MEYKRLGNSGINVSRISLGTNNFGGQVTEKYSIAIINKAIDLGINSIDTANIYPLHPRARATKGISEKIIGKAVKDRRDDIIIATKVGMIIGQGLDEGRARNDGHVIDLSRKHILWQIRQSLENLNTDFIDLYYLHEFDPNTPLEETLRTLNDLVRDGRVRYIACSNFTALQIAKSQAICDAHDLEKFVAVQLGYNLLNRRVEKNLLPFCEHDKMGVLTFSPLESGYLTGKYKKDEPPPRESRGAVDPIWWERIKKREGTRYSILERIANVAEEVGIPMHKLAIAWILKNPSVTGSIVGASNLEQVEENCSLTEISNKVYKKLNEATEFP